MESGCTVCHPRFFATGIAYPEEQSSKGYPQMDAQTDEEPPKSTDLPGWRQAVADERFRCFPMEAIVAAIQDLGPSTDKMVRSALAKHLNDDIYDYLVKPFATKELIARIKALLRRPGHALGITLETGNVVFDTMGRSVRRGETALIFHGRSLLFSNT